MQTNPAVEQNKNIKWSESPSNQSDRKPALGKTHRHETRSRQLPGAVFGVDLWTVAYVVGFILYDNEDDTRSYLMRRSAVCGTEHLLGRLNECAIRHACIGYEERSKSS